MDAAGLRGCPPDRPGRSTGVRQAPHLVAQGGCFTAAQQSAVLAALPPCCVAPWSPGMSLAVQGWQAGAGARFAGGSLCGFVACKGDEDPPHNTTFAAPSALHLPCAPQPRIPLRDMWPRARQRPALRATTGPVVHTAHPSITCVGPVAGAQNPAERTRSPSARTTVTTDGGPGV